MPQTEPLQEASEADDEAMSRDTRVEQLLQSWNLPFELDLKYPLSRLIIEEVTQIRDQPHRAPKTTVDQYVTHMRHGAIFPPIVLSAPAFLVDGNARVEACRILNRKTFPAYKVKFPHLGMAPMIGAALNQLGGDRLSDEEIVKAAEAMMAEAYPDESIARTLGRSMGHVRNVRRDRTFRDAIKRIGREDVRLPKQVARVLAGIKNDEPLKAAIEVVHHAKPALKDVTKLVQAIEATHSDAEALASITGVATQWGPVTGPPPTTAKRSLSGSQAKKALELVRKILALGDSPADLVLGNDEEAAKAWSQLNILSTKVLALSAGKDVEPTA
jgi:hypothetical protein